MIIMLLFAAAVALWALLPKSKAEAKAEAEIPAEEFIGPPLPPSIIRRRLVARMRPLHMPDAPPSPHHPRRLRLPRQVPHLQRALAHAAVS